MIMNPKNITLKNGRKAVLRSPLISEAIGMIEYLKTCASETEFILRYPEECIDTPEQEANFLAGINTSESSLMVVCVIPEGDEIQTVERQADETQMDGTIVGSCHLMCQQRLKVRHRASVGISVIQQYWNLGIATAMFEEIIAVAKQNGILQLELEYIEGNERAKRLYEKLGFIQVAEHPDAIRLKDGTMLKEYAMVKKL